MDYTVRGILQARILVVGSHSLPRDLPNPGIKPRSPTFQADSLPAEPPGKPREAEVKDLKEWRIYLSPRYFLPEIWGKTSMFIRNSRSLKWLQNYQRCKGSINSLVTNVGIYLSFLIICCSLDNSTPSHKWASGTHDSEELRSQEEAIAIVQVWELEQWRVLDGDRGDKRRDLILENRERQKHQSRATGLKWQITPPRPFLANICFSNVSTRNV